MFRFQRWFVCAVSMLTCAIADTPQLTTIQDSLYTADGNRYSGVATITWKSFEAADSSNVATQIKRVQIANGNLFVELVPTTTSVTPASYFVQYASAGRIQF